MSVRKLKRRLEAGFGTIPDPVYFHGDMENIRVYHDLRKEQQQDAFLIDDATWHDLDMDRVFKRINLGLSSSGEQYLYHTLRSPAIEKEQYARRHTLIALMEKFPDLRLKLEVILARLGRTRCADLTRAFQPEERGLLWLFIYLFFALLVPAALIFTLFSKAYGLMACFGVITINSLLHEHRKRKCQRDFDTVNYTVSMVFALHKIRKLKHPELDPHLQSAYENLDRLHAVLQTGGVSTIRDGGIGEFILTVLLLDLILYEFLKNKLGRCHTEVFAVHESLGQLETAIAVASYRKSLGSFAVPELDFSPETAYLFASEMTHPLLRHAVPNDLHTEKPILITGSNASGKSTYLKTAALCVLLAQSICTVTAKAYRASAFRIYSSMALSDNLLAGESYYIAETKSLKRILEQTPGKIPLFCTIDEVLRGTNTIERIAASSKLLEVIAREGALCLAATHDIELCDLLCAQYDLYHFEEQLGETEMLFDYRIYPGKAMSRNAINLLKLLGFDAQIVSGAHERANAYMQYGVWR